MKTPDKPKILPYKWIADERPIAMEWRVKGLMPKKGLGLLIGYRAAGKTWIALSPSLCSSRAHVCLAQRHPVF